MRRLAFVLALSWLAALGCDSRAVFEVCIPLDSITTDSTAVRVWKTPCR